MFHHLPMGQLRKVGSTAPSRVRPGQGSGAALAGRGGSRRRARRSRLRSGVLRRIGFRGQPGVRRTEAFEGGLGWRLTAMSGRLLRQPERRVKTGCCPSRSAVERQRLQGPFVFRPDVRPQYPGTCWALAINPMPRPATKRVTGDRQL